MKLSVLSAHGDVTLNVTCDQDLCPQLPYVPRAWLAQVNGGLNICELSSRSCISSQNDEEDHWAPPWIFESSVSEAVQRLKAVATGMPKHQGPHAYARVSSGQMWHPHDVCASADMTKRVCTVFCLPAADAGAKQHTENVHGVTSTARGSNSCVAGEAAGAAAYTGGQSLGGLANPLHGLAGRCVCTSRCSLSLCITLLRSIQTLADNTGSSPGCK